MITFNIFFHKKTNAIRVRLISNRKKTEISLGIQTDALGYAALISNKPTKEQKNIYSLFCSYRRQLELVCTELSEANLTDIKTIREEVQIALFGSVSPASHSASEMKAPDNFVACFEKFISLKTNRGTKGVYLHTLDRMRLFDPNLDEYGFKDIDFKWLTDFETFCARTASKNARNIHLRNIRAVFNNAIDNELTTLYPFRRFKIRPEETRKRSLTVEELRHVFDYPAEPYAVFYRDMFKLIFMLIGINTVDLHRLKSITPDGRIEYKRAKTGRLYSIKVEPEMLDIIEQYRGKKGLLIVADRWKDSRNFRHQINNALQSLGAHKNKGGRNPGGSPKRSSVQNTTQGLWPELTTYWARHTWATIAADLDIPDAVIGQALGHSAGTVTDIYIKRNEKKVDEANRRVLDYVLYDKR